MTSYLGINIGGTTCSVSRGTVEKGIEVRESFPNPGEVGVTLAKLTELAGRLGNGTVSACGISCGGPLDAERGIVLSPPNLPGWDRVEIVNVISKATGKPAFLMNDANAGALAEWYVADDDSVKNLVFLTCGTGMGAGIIADGRLLEGARGDAGEVGHIRLTPKGPVGYHKAGSFEGWCSGGGFMRLNGISAKEAAERARVGDNTAREMFRTFGRRLGAALAVIIDILNPERIVIGGIYLRSHDLIDEAMGEVLRAEALPPPRSVTMIVPSACGESIGDLAALAIARYREH
jgi:glucokinase